MNDTPNLQESTQPSVSADPKISAVTQTTMYRKGDEDSDSTDDDELLDSLDDSEFDFGSLRERRMGDLKERLAKVKEIENKAHGRYTELIDEKEVMEASASEERCVIHFAHKDFKRCQIMDRHLEAIAPKYFSTRFLRVSVENVPWLVEKLSIKVLPCVICFINGVTKYRMVGFEEVGNQDTFETSLLELRLNMSGVLEEPIKQARTHEIANTGSRKLIRQTARDDDDEDFDL